ncbi:MAG: hypothetical protein HC852_23470 [Acaryochloridaceae cyanobacterium RU_4_10]|nr:hypothetical protein [Acaryochloridaceae cyanobacterium RU_4_10]
MGGGIINSSHQIMVDIYTPNYPLLPWISSTILLFATPIAAVGILQNLSDTNPENTLPRNVFFYVPVFGDLFVWGRIRVRSSLPSRAGNIERGYKTT